ncbi:MAG: ATP-binding protein [Bacillota bacterium]|nr:ATP-binding protein [Bacillota bacterium]
MTVQELALHILDLFRNAVEAGARTVYIAVREDSASDRMEIEVRDDGRGMTPNQARTACDPFFTTRTTRRVGMGLALLQAAAEQAGGELRIESAPGEGTRVVATFRRGHIDRAPLGDMAATLEVAVAEPGVDVEYEHRRDGWVFRFSTEELKRFLGVSARDDPGVLAWVNRHIAEGERALSSPRNALSPSPENGLLSPVAARAAAGNLSLARGGEVVGGCKEVHLT